MGAPGAVVVGTSFGCLTHVRALRAAGFDVIGLVGRDPERTVERAKRFGVPRPTTSLSAALDLPGVDAVTIATPPHTHAPLVLECLAAGKHVLCEKPFARDAAEARTMLAAAEAADVVHLLGTEFRWGTGQALMARVVRSGAIGEPRMATFVLNIPLLADPSADVPGWWSDRERGGGWLGAHAAHVVDQVRTTLGEFAGVSAALPRLADRDWTAEDTYSVHFRTHVGLRRHVAQRARPTGARSSPSLASPAPPAPCGPKAIGADRGRLGHPRRAGPRRPRHPASGASRRRSARVGLRPAPLHGDRSGPVHAARPRRFGP